MDSMEVEGESNPQTTIVVGLVIITLFWLVAFYAMIGTHHRWGRYVPPSTKEHENDPKWMARNILGGVMATLVSGLCLPILWWSRNLSGLACFDGIDGAAVAFCTTDPIRFYGGWGAMIFIAYTVSDSILMAVHGWCAPDYVIHHILFIAAGLIIRGHCMLRCNGGILLSLEATTPFLNTAIFFRNRGPQFGRLLFFVGIILMVGFVLLRILLCSYGTIYLLMNVDLLFQVAPAWESWTVLVVVTAGTAVQYFWFAPLLNAFGQNIWGGQLLKAKELPDGEKPLIQQDDA